MMQNNSAATNNTINSNGSNAGTAARGARDELSAALDKTVTLASLEQKVVKFFFKESKDDACRKQYGLEQPMWVWTHHSGNTIANCLEEECLKLTNLLHWLVINCHTAPTEITLVAPTDLFKKVKAAFQWKVSSGSRGNNNSVGTSPVASNEPTTFPGNDNSNTSSPVVVNKANALEFITFVAMEKLQPNDPLPEKHTQVGIVSFGGIPPTKASSPSVPVMNPLAGMRHATQNSTDVLIVLCDAAWVYSMELATLSPQLANTWCPVAEYLRRELGTGRPVRLSRDTVIPRGTPTLKLTTLIGSKMPVCCPRHLYERSLRSGKVAFDGFCRQACLFPFACGNAGHVCVEPCHDVSDHRCPYPCVKALRCGHACRKTCSEPCDCLNEITKPLACSHRIAVGFDAATQITSYRTISHEFKGACVSSNLPCRIDVPVICAHCFGDFKAPCSQVTAQGHTNEVPTIVCADCVRRERDIRQEVRQELVEKLASNRKELRWAMKKELSRYKSMTEGGFFQVGQRVYLNDVEALQWAYEPDFEDTVKFEDFNAPDFKKRMEGIHGVVKASMTDPSDLEDIQCLIEIPNGLHILASSSGLQSIRALCSSAATSGATLMIAGPKATTTNGSGAAEVADGGKSSMWGTLQPLVGSLVHVLHPVDYFPVNTAAKGDSTGITSAPTQPDCDPVKLVDVVGRIIDEDSEKCSSMGEAHVKVEITLPYGNSFVTQSFEQQEETRKRAREGADEEQDPTQQTEVVLVVSAPLASLDIIQLMKRDILISDRAKQLLEPEELLDFYDICELAVKRKVPTDVLKKIRSVGIRDYPSKEGEVFEVLDIVNYPFDVRPQLVTDLGDGGMETRHGQHVDDRGFLKTKQPHALLISRSFYDHMRLGVPKPKTRSYKQRSSSTSVAAVSNEREFPTRCEVAVVPLLFAGVDEEAEAERKLEKDTLKKLHEISSERYQELCDKLAFENEDARFQKEQKLPNRSQEQVDTQTSEALALLLADSRLTTEEADGSDQAAAAPVEMASKVRKYPPVVEYSMPHPLKAKHAISALESRFAHLPQPMPPLKVIMQRKKATILAKQANSVEGATGWCAATNTELAEMSKLDRTYVSSK